MFGYTVFRIQFYTSIDLRMFGKSILLKKMFILWARRFRNKDFLIFTLIFMIIISF